jgi:Ca2+-binding RTX toxin-like protein
LTDNAGGRFTIDTNTGVVTVADTSLLDFETATSHTVTVQATSTDGSTSTETFTINLTDDTLEAAVGPVTDSDGTANTISESVANGSAVGLTGLATDADATDTVTYSLTDNAGGRFTIDTNTGVVTVADTSLLDFETATSHTVTVQATTFTINLTDDTSEAAVGPVTDSDGTANVISESVANGTAVGLTGLATDADATDTVTYSLTDNAGGRFTIDTNTGIVTVADTSLLDYETATSHTVTVQATSTDGSTSTETFTINLTDDRPVSDLDGSANTIAEDVPNGTVVGITAIASDPDPADSVTYALTDNAGGRFAIDANTGVVTVADSSMFDYETATSHTVTVEATSTDGSTSTESFTINLEEDFDESGDGTDDIINGGGGSQTIYGGDGDDTLSGGPGQDFLYGGSGNDVLDGGVGNDKLYGGSGNDNLDGGIGLDELFGGTGDDTIYGQGGADQIHGGADNDVLFGGSEGDSLYGESGNDILYGEDGGDTLTGGIGDDTLIGGAGNDTGIGGDGNDLYIFGNGDGTDSFDGGGGTWTDAIELSGHDGEAAYSDWTLDGATVVETGSDYLVLSEDSAGTITMDDGSEITFTGVDRIEW